MSLYLENIQGNEFTINIHRLIMQRNVLKFDTPQLKCTRNMNKLMQSTDVSELGKSVVKDRRLVS